MSECTFEEFYTAAWNRDPHRWQIRLADQVLRTGRWPDVIDLPTGSGKTSAIDVAVYCLAMRPEVLPRRIAFVIDRRLIVDQTSSHARKLALRLEEALKEDGGPVRFAAEKLQALTGGDVPLDVAGLRGGDKEEGQLLGTEWLRRPDQPAVIVSTVDQFGSRLLFGGYGVSAVMRPIHAGLTGHDCLVLLDEVHLSAALAETLRYLEQDANTVRSLGERRWQMVQMSATPVGAVGDRFTLAPGEDADGSPLAKVVSAEKSARLVTIGAVRQNEQAAWVQAMPSLLTTLGCDSGVIGVVVNRVATAVAVAEDLRRREEDVVLLTGRMRRYERREAEAKAEAWGDPDRAEETRGPTAGRRFVVATQCIEVGADLSFDGLITEACPLSSLKQRFGRLDRRGRAAAAGRAAPALVVGVAANLAGKEPDPVYGEALAGTWRALSERFGDDAFDAGPLALPRSDFGAEVEQPTPTAAVLMPKHLDLLSWTNPVSDVAPDIDPFLHGFREPDQDVSLLWRQDIDDTHRELAQRALDLLPPLAGESVDVPIRAVRRWLAGLATEDLSDVDSVLAGVEPETQDARPCWRWTADSVDPVKAGDLRPGDVLVVPCEYGGLTGGVWDPTSRTRVPDVAAEVSGDVLTEADLLVHQVAGTALAPALYRLGEPLSLSGNAEGQNDAGSSSEKSAADADPEETEETRRDQLRAMYPGLTSRQVISYGAEGNRRWAIDTRHPGRPRAWGGSDAANSFGGVPVTLRDHLDGVAREAEGCARRCGLSEALVADLRLAASLHDLGKLDPRFQEELFGDALAAAAADEPRAKSGMPGKHWVYPSWMRHEFLSAEIAATHEHLLADAHDRDLVLHLIEAHHGRARPLVRVTADPDPQQASWQVGGEKITGISTLPGETVGAASAERFALLTRRYGWHGLAWLEGILRLADHRRSAEESADESKEGKQNG